MAKSSAAKTGINDLLLQLDAAFDEAQSKAKYLSEVQSAQVRAVAEAQVVYEAVQADHQAKVDSAAAESELARQALDKLRESVNERVGSLTGSGQAKGWSSVIS